MWDWNAVTALAAVVSTAAYIVTALYIRAELKALDKDRYLAVTSQLFTLWQSQDFMRDQLWLLHRLAETRWPDFLQKHRGDMGEIVFHRVGSFYDRVGTLVRLGLIGREETLTTMAPYAIAVWRKIEPLVREARQLENSQLFTDFERLLPACHECYVPLLAADVAVAPFTAGQNTSAAPRLSIAELQARLARGAPMTLLDVRRPAEVAAAPRPIADARWIPPDEIAQRSTELPANRAVIVYCA